MQEGQAGNLAIASTASTKDPDHNGINRLWRNIIVFLSPKRSFYRHFSWAPFLLLGLLSVHFSLITTEPKKLTFGNYFPIYSSSTCGDSGRALCRVASSCFWVESERATALSNEQPAAYSALCTIVRNFSVHNRAIQPSWKTPVCSFSFELNL